MKMLSASLAAVTASLCVWAAVGHAADQPAGKLDAPVIGTTLAAGFIRPSISYEAHVSAITGDNNTTGNKRLLGAGDQIYLDLNNPQEAAPGDQYTIYRTVKKVYHPTRGKYLGELTTVVGVVKVTKITGRQATVKIVRSYDAMFPGDGAIRQTSAAPPALSAQPLPDGTGMIIELPPGQTLIGQGHMVYVDWGRNDGVKAGDKLQVFRESAGIPLQIIGEMEIVAVEDQTATARVLKSIAPLVRGDRFAARNTLEKQQGADAPMSLSDRKEALFQDMPAPSATDMLPGGDIPEFGKTK
jgi:chemotaxis protein MotB